MVASFFVAPCVPMEILKLQVLDSLRPYDMADRENRKCVSRERTNEETDIEADRLFTRCDLGLGAESHGPVELHLSLHRLSKVKLGPF